MGLSLVYPHSGPFVTAGVLRSRFSSIWTKDRGTNPEGAERCDNVPDGPVGCRT
jgi:hypothetical protein